MVAVVNGGSIYTNEEFGSGQFSAVSMYRLLTNLGHRSLAPNWY